MNKEPDMANMQLHWTAALAAEQTGKHLPR
jgi:hypothetical protein